MSMDYAVQCLQSRQSARHSLQSSELSPPAPNTFKRVLPPPFFCSRGGEGAGGANSDEETDTLVLEV